MVSCVVLNRGSTVFPSKSIYGKSYPCIYHYPSGRCDSHLSFLPPSSQSLRVSPRVSEVNHLYTYTMRNTYGHGANIPMFYTYSLARSLGSDISDPIVMQRVKVCTDFLVQEQQKTRWKFAQKPVLKGRGWLVGMDHGTYTIGDDEGMGF